jgi:hypothetical protein
LEIEGARFSMETLMKCRSKECFRKLITDDVIAPFDKMKIDPVTKIMDKRLWKPLLSSNNSEEKVLGVYLKFMYKFYNLFLKRNTTDKKITTAKSLLIFLKDWKDKEEEAFLFMMNYLNMM